MSEQLFRSVADNRISAVHPTGMRMLRTQAHLAGWSIAKDFGLPSTQSDAVVDRVFDAVIALLRRWESASDASQAGQEAGT